MPYGNFSKPKTYVSTTSTNRTTGSGGISYSSNLISCNETRAGSNHAPAHGGHLATLQERYSFSPDGRSIRMRIGEQVIPVRRYKWVNGPNGSRYKSYYMTSITKQVFVSIPKPTYTFRNANLNRQLLGLLRPNPLDYKIDERTYPDLVITSGYDSRDKHSFSVSSNGVLRGNMASGAAQSSMGQRDFFSTLDYLPTSSQINSLSNSALTGLYEKVANRFPDVGTMAGESKETLGMLRTLLNEGVDFAIDLIKKDKARLLGRLKAPVDFASNAWLTYVYGVKPAFNDYQSLIKLPNERGIRQYSKSSKYEIPWVSADTPNGLTHLVANFRAAIQVKYGVYMSADLKTQQKLSAMNLFNVVGVGYNIIPFSFMLDWFINIGQYLNSESALQYGFLYGWKTTYYTREWSCYQQPSSTNSRYSVGGSGLILHAHRRTVEVERKPLIKQEFPSMPTPKFALDGLSSMKGVNTLAILVQRHKAFKQL